tara:strand:- start:535 stop:885 length:351 start_codon:yes stop_codon:yes gene_type:complete
MEPSGGGVEDWHELASFIEAPPKKPLVVQFGTAACKLCPDASMRIHELAKIYHFEWHYMDATISQLAEELQVTKLPAVLVFHSADRYTLYQQLRGDEVDQAINAQCEKRLVLDADF